MAVGEQGVRRLDLGEARALVAVPTRGPAWVLVEEGFTLAREHEIESLFAVANGYVGTRGSLAEGSPLSAPATFIAGVFDLLPPWHLPQLVTVPDWLRLRAVVNGSPIRLEDGEILEHRRALDLRQGILWREWRQRDPTGRVTHIRGLRLASLADRHLLLQVVTLTAENYSGRVLLESRIEGPPAEDAAAVTFTRLPFPLAPTGLTPRVAAHSSQRAVLSMRTASTGIVIAFASATRIAIAGEESAPAEVAVASGDDRLSERWAVDVQIGTTYRFERIVAVFTSRDTEHPADTASDHVERAVARGGAAPVVAAHTSAWSARWRGAAMTVDGDAGAQRALRFAAYHLIGAANPDDERVSVGARALTGHTYGGHVFWDTEIFMLPFYLLTHPPTARTLLMYRHHTLPGARAKARAFGYRGALYPWESADAGVEATPPYGWLPDGRMVEIRTGLEEHHISADVAYAVWQYWRATGDDAFLLAAGAEILLDTARFWASRGALEADGRYHIRRVIGPDEYHESVDDDAYTNLMAQWNLERGVETARCLEARWPGRWRELSERLALTAGEIEEWQRLSDAMYTGFDSATGLYEQFRGYFALEDVDLASYEPRTAPMDVVLGPERLRHTQIIKQPDVVMALHLLWDRFPHQVREANFRYYEARTSHGSSLSPAIHALVAARLGDRELAARYFRQAAEIDLANNMGNAAGGVHAGALGGLWQAAAFGAAGLRLRDDALVIDPHLLPGWSALRFPIEWRGQTLNLVTYEDPPRIDVQIAGDSAVPIAVADGPAVPLSPGCRCTIERTSDGWGAWREVPR